MQNEFIQKNTDNFEIFYHKNLEYFIQNSLSIFEQKKRIDKKHFWKNPR